MSDSAAELLQAWWDPKADEAKRRDGQLAAVRKIVDAQKDRYALHKLYYGLYLGRDPVGLSPTGYARGAPMAPQDALRYNLVQSVIDTKLAKLAKNTPRTRFLTSGGKWGAQQRARKLTQFVDGERYRLEQAAKDAKVRLHAAIFGLGVLHVFEAPDACVGTEWVFPDEIKVDDQDGMYGAPRSLHRQKTVAKEELLRRFAAGGDGGKFRQAILAAPLLTALGNKFAGPEQLLCTVAESWHLPGGETETETETETEADSENPAEEQGESRADGDESGESKESGDGRHMLSIEGASFTDEAWDEDDFPFVFLRFGAMPLGFWGRGDAEDLKPIQRELTRSLMRLQEILFLCAVPRIFLPVGSQVNKTHIRNMVGDIIEYAGNQTPTMEVADGVPTGLVSHIQQLVAWGYEQVGLTAMSATGQKPEGLDSAPSLREYHDIESERFMEAGKAVEAYHLAVDRKILHTARRIAEREGDYETRAPQERDFAAVRWKEIDLSEDQYVMQAYPVSMLSHTVAGRLAEVKDLMDLGMLDQNTAYKLMDMPDLQSVNSLELAAVQDIDRVIEKVLYEGKWDEPDPQQNLEYGARMMQLAYLRARQDGAPQENLGLAVEWMDKARALLQQAALAEQAAAAPPTGAAMPPAVPGGPMPLQLPGGGAQAPGPEAMGPEVPGAGVVPS